MIVALIPAHNEEAGIVATIHSLQGQTLPPDRILVVADNCEDQTADLAKNAGAEVFETVGNLHKKAGALNQVLDSLIHSLGETDRVLILDADGSLQQDWIESAVKKLTRQMGAVSGVCRTRAHKGLVSSLQAAEYAQDFRRTSRRQGKTNVLSGAAALFTSEALWALYRNRGNVYDPHSLTEDFEVTLKLKMLGYSPRCFKSLVVITDVMTSWGDLWTQRLRWQRGTLEALMGIGYNRTTRKMFGSIVLCYLSTILLAFTFLLWGATLYFGLELSSFWLFLMPIFMTEQWVTSRGAGLKASAIASILIPMWGYGIFRSCVYWSALYRAARGADKIWIT